MSIITSIKIEGLKGLEKKLDPKPLLGGAVKELLEKASLLIEGIAKKKATGRPGPKVITDRLRSSITYTIDAAPVPLWGRIGTNVEYAQFVEHGHSQEPGRYVPAIGARLVVSEVRAYPFLGPARKEAAPRVEKALDRARKLIEDAWKK